MCISCNPMCGHCHPPKKRVVFCPECDEYNLFDIVVCDPPIQRFCKKCGLELTKHTIPSIVRCKNTGKLCANPCHYSTVLPNENIKRVCRENTPPPRSKQAANKHAYYIGDFEGVVQEVPYIEN